MTVIYIPYCKGERPIFNPQALANVNAQLAINADLKDGGIRSIYAPGDVIALSGISVDPLEIFKVTYGSTTFWALSACRASFCKAPMASSAGRFFWTDGVRFKKSDYNVASNTGVSISTGTYGKYGSGLKWGDGSLWGMGAVTTVVSYGEPWEYYGGGLPKPSTKLTLALQGAGTVLQDSVSYVWSWVTPWGEESQTSDPTDVYDVNVGEYPRLSAFDEPSDLDYPYNVIGIKIYRINTGTNANAEYQEITELYDSVDGTYKKICDLANGTGSIEVSGTAVTGTLTTFSSDGISAGDYILCRGQWLKVASVDSETAITLDGSGASVDIPKWSPFKFGTSWLTTDGYLDDVNLASEMTDTALLGDTIVSEDWTEPYDTIDNLVVMTNNCFAASRNNEFYVFEPGYPFTAPIKYQRVTTDDIQALGVSGNSVIAATKSHPYVFTCDDPNNITITVIQEKQSCLFKRSMVSGDGFCAWASPDGIVLYSFSGGMMLLTKNIFTKSQWKELLSTDTSSSATTFDKKLVSFLYDGKYITFFEGTNSGFSIDLATEDASEAYARFTLPPGYMVYGGCVDPITDTLYLLIKYDAAYYIKSWEGATDKLTTVWKSKKFYYTAPTVISCGVITGDYTIGVLLRVYADGVQVGGDIVVNTNTPFLFGTGAGSPPIMQWDTSYDMVLWDGGFDRVLWQDTTDVNAVKPANTWEFEIIGSEDINPKMLFATTMQELMKAIQDV